ncbi:polysaccharide pyruvyl transferase family protein, partial [bacterium]|nr:polysaccharide pyruvyl transferase family protein [bacterium]
EYFEQPNTIISDLPSDYLSLYAQVSTVYSDRVHACIPALAFGNQAMFFCKNTPPRLRMFRRIGAPDILKMPVKLNMEQLRNEKEKQVKFIMSIIT